MESVTHYFDCVDCIDAFVEDLGGLLLIEHDEIVNGAPFEFDQRLTEIQAVALKKALWRASTQWLIPNDELKAQFNEQMILETIDLNIMWEGDYPGFSLENKEDYNDFVWVLAEDIIPSLKTKYSLKKRES